MEDRRPILLVEDNPMDVDLTQRAFAKRHIVNVLEVARDGEEALDWIARWEAGHPLPVVILLDLKLPRVSGLEVLRQLKAHPDYCRIPVVVLTTTDDKVEIQRCYDLGCNVYITKPVNYENFANAIRQLGLFFSVIQVPSPD